MLSKKNKGFEKRLVKAIKIFLKKKKKHQYCGDRHKNISEDEKKNSRIGE